MTMQRFAYHPGEGILRGNDNGDYVRFIDAEAAITAAEQRGYNSGYVDGSKDSRAGAFREAIEAVYALVTTRGYDLDDYSAAEALAALRGLGGSDDS